MAGRRQRERRVALATGTLVTWELQFHWGILLRSRGRALGVFLLSRAGRLCSTWLREVLPLSDNGHRRFK